MTIPFTSSAALTEDEIDDALYLARTGESADFQQFLDELSQKYGALQANVVKSAVDAESGNSALHFASANGHTGV